MKSVLRTVVGCLVTVVLVTALGTHAWGQQATFRSPQPGDVYKEYIRLLEYDVETRVTWPLASDPRAQEGLPNPTLDITVDDLSGATRAELVIDFWGGHSGTVGEQISFNGNEWLDVPVLNTVPESPECYTNMRNITMDIPLAHLASGVNHFVGNSGGQTCNNFQWGLWGWYGVILRVYYSNAKPHATGTISSYSSGGTLPENPVIAASVSGSVSRVDFLAYYDGYDEDGDGVYRDYHQSYHTMKFEYALPIRNHVGSATSAPWQVTWNTDWVPDQDAGSVKLLARICDANGYWYVTPEVTGLSLQRSGTSVRIYRPTDVPTLWQTRASNLMTCHIPIPADHDLSKATVAQFHMRTWNGLDGGELDPNDHYYTKINDWYTPQYGALYFYSYDVLDIPTSAITNGSNTISYYATSMGHGIELLWPGPALVVKYSSQITSSVPGTPTLASPGNNSTNTVRTPTLSWNSVSAATVYQLQVATDQAFTALVYTDSSLTTTSHELAELALMTQYYWRVRAGNTSGWSEYSSAWTFTTTLGLPGTTSLVAPPNNATNQAVSGVVCRWNPLPTATQYRFQLATDSLFASGIVRNDSTLTDTTQSLTGLTSGTTYYWHVAGRNADGTGPYAAFWRFTTIVPPPGAVTLASPADNAAGGFDTMKCVWRPTTPASTKYWFEIARDSAFTLSRSVDSTLTDTAKTVRGLVNATKYYWRVRGGNAAGWGLFSSIWRFTPVFTSVASGDGLPTGITLNQNFPNPFNPTTQIEFGLPKESRARLEVYDVLGGLVLTLADGVLAAGYHRVTFSAESLPSGVYLYRLTTPESSLTRKMLLVR